MSRYVLAFFVMASAVGFVCEPGEAQVRFDLQNGGSTNPRALRVGETATIDVVVGGLEPNQTLIGLGATVAFDDEGLLGKPTVTPGPIVPQPTHAPRDFLWATDAGMADGTFWTQADEPEYHITTEGAFFSFTVKALTEGRGHFGFDFAGAVAPNPTDPRNPFYLDVTKGPEFEFAVVPEPTTAAHALVMAGLAGFWWSRRSRPRS